MAGNNLIQVCRGENKNSTEVLLDGQPYFDKGSNILKIGNGDSTSIQDTLPINANLYLEEFWKGIASGEAQVRVGDKPFVTVDGYSVPTTCVNIEYSSSGAATAITFMMDWPSNIAITGLFPFNYSEFFPLQDNIQWGDSCYYYLLNGGSVQGNMSSMNFDSICIFKKLPSYLQDIIIPYTVTDRADHIKNANLWAPRLEHIYGYEIRDRKVPSLSPDTSNTKKFSDVMTDGTAFHQLDSNIKQFQYFEYNINPPGASIYTYVNPNVSNLNSNMTVFLSSTSTGPTEEGMGEDVSSYWAVWKADGTPDLLYDAYRYKYACAICFAVRVTT